MGLLDIALGSTSPVSCYLYPEPDAATPPALEDRQNLFVFQYWPESLDISYEPIYAERQIPASTHPLYQWVGGNGRTISFSAIFTSEVDQTSLLNLVPSNITPSGRYTVDVAAAIARLQSYMMPTYSDSSSLNGVVKPPRRLILAFPGTGLAGGGSENRTSQAANTRTASQSLTSATRGIRGRPPATYDAVTVLLVSAPIRIESWFPSGEPRIASVALTFKEVIQRNSSGSTSITYVGADPFKALGAGYQYSGRIDQIATAGGN